MLFVSSCHLSPLMKPWRAETYYRSGVHTSLNSCLPRALSGCSGIANSPFPDPSPSAFPAKDGARCALPCEAEGLSSSTYYRRSQAEFANDYILVRRLIPCRSSSLACFFALLPLVDCRPFANCRQREFDSSLSTYTDALSTTRVRLDAISKLFPGCVTVLCVDKPSLNAAQTLDEQSANAVVRELECVCRGITDNTVTE